MTEPEIVDRRRWAVSWETLNGERRARVLCTEHKRRHESACVSVGLPRPTSTPAVESSRCRGCPGPNGGGRPRGPMLGRAKPVRS